MSDLGLQRAKTSLGNVITFVNSRVINQNLTNQSEMQLIDAQIAAIEGTEDKAGQISQIEKIKSDIEQLTTAIANDPTLIE